LLRSYFAQIFAEVEGWLERIRRYRTRRDMAAIKAAAEKSGLATEATISALGYNDAAIEDATDPVEQTGLLGYSLLVCRNFVDAVVGGITRYGRSAVATVGPKLRDLREDAWTGTRVGVRATTALVPPTALVGFAVWLSDPVTGIAVTVTAFRPIAQILKSLGREEAAGGKRPSKKRGKKPTE
jgi:hypothetical protein